MVAATVDSTNNNNSSSIKFLYSYGGRILPRATDGKLRYVGGHTRVLSVNRSVSFAELLVKFVESCGSSVTLRCQLPTEDLDTLVTVTSDEDLGNLIEEYDRVSSSPCKIRAILSPPKSLKAVTPPSSRTSSVDSASSSALKPPLPSHPCLRRTSIPLEALPADPRRDAVKARFPPCCVQANPRRPALLVPYLNRRL